MSGPLAPSVYNPALDALDGSRVNEVRLAKAHNSYLKRDGDEGWKNISDALSHTNVVEIDVWPPQFRDDFPVGHDGRRLNNCRKRERWMSRRNAWLSDCLAEIREWSDDHPNHPLIIVNVDAKTGFWGKYDLFDEIVEDELGVEKLFRPLDLRGTHPDLRCAVEAEGWPKLAELRGRIMVVMTGGTPTKGRRLGNDRNEFLKRYVKRQYVEDEFAASAFVCPDVTEWDDLEPDGHWRRLDSVKRNIVCGNVQRAVVDRLHTESASFRQTLVLAWGYGRSAAEITHATNHWLSAVGVDLSSMAPDPGAFIGVRGGAVTEAGEAGGVSSELATSATTGTRTEPARTLRTEPARR